MQHMKLKLAAAITAALLSTNAMADSWTITQDTTPGSDTTVTQNGATSGGSVQAMNAINGVANAAGTQTAAMTTKTLTLKQEGTTTGSTQAANYVKGTNIGTDASTALTQQHTGTAADADITLTQNPTTGTGNTQAVNTAQGTTEIINLMQDATNSASIGLTQDTVGANTQAVNNLEADTTLTKATQQAGTATAGLINLDQKGTGDQTQAVNRANGVTMGGLTQSATASNTATLNTSGHQLKQTAVSTNGSKQALNMVTGTDLSKASAASTQTATGALTFEQLGVASRMIIFL